MKAQKNNSFFDRVASKIEKFGAKYPKLFSLSLLVYGFYLCGIKDFVAGFSFIFLSVIFFVLLTSISKNLDFTDRVMTFTIILVMLFFLITFIASAIAKLYAPLEIRFGGIDAWIGFAGSILGSSITMFALVFTLSYENKMRRNDMAIQSIPLLRIDVDQKSLEYISAQPGELNSDGFHCDIFGDVDFFQIVINNESLNFASNVKFSKFSYIIRKPFDIGKFSDTEFRVDVNALNKRFEGVLIPGKFNRKVQCYLKGDLGKNSVISLEIELAYSDYLGEIQHSVVSEGSINVYYDDKICNYKLSTQGLGSTYINTDHNTNN